VRFALYDTAVIRDHHPHTRYVGGVDWHVRNGRRRLPLADDRTRVDLLGAAFPGGSITGAPKIRAMQIIDELEPTPRDGYCGAVGCIGLDGSLSLNVAIRTMVMHGPAVHLYAGGGIVADSQPRAEYEETLAKATGMIRALGHDAATRGTP